MDYYSGLILGLTSASGGRNVGGRASSLKDHARYRISVDRAPYYERINSV